MGHIREYVGLKFPQLSKKAEENKTLYENDLYKIALNLSPIFLGIVRCLLQKNELFKGVDRLSILCQCFYCFLLYFLCTSMRKKLIVLYFFEMVINQRKHGWSTDCLIIYIYIIDDYFCIKLWIFKILFILNTTIAGHFAPLYLFFHFIFFCFTVCLFSPLLSPFSPYLGWWIWLAPSDKINVQNTQIQKLWPWVRH